MVNTIDNLNLSILKIINKKWDLLTIARILSYNFIT